MVFFEYSSNAVHLTVIIVCKLLLMRLRREDFEILLQPGIKQSISELVLAGTND